MSDGTPGTPGVWTCKVGYGEHLPPGADGPMREAVAEAFERLCGGEPDFIFSGWGDVLSEGERAVVDDRAPDPYVVAAECERQIAELTTIRDQALSYALEAR